VALSALEKRLRTSLAAADAKTQAAEISREVRRDCDCAAHATVERATPHLPVLWLKAEAKWL
jgi:hypothetical protein